MGRRRLTDLKYVHAFVDRTGRPRFYFRRHGKRVRLIGVPGSREFLDSYAAAFGSQALSNPSSRQPAAPGTFAALANAYFASSYYRALAAVTRTDYRRVLDRFLKEHGHRRVDQMTRAHVDVVIGKMADRPGAGIILLKRLRTLVRYAMAIGWIDRDPTAGAKSYRSKEIHTWTEDEIGTFEKRWPLGARERLAFVLLLYTGQRGSDVRRMTWADIAGDTIRVVQRKTGTKLIVPLHPALQAALARAPRDHLNILATAYKKPFSEKGFQNMVSAAIREAGLPSRCKAHGLRKASARRLAESGATEKQIAAITGHKTLAEVQRYTRAADQESLARQAVEKQKLNETGKLADRKMAN
jgi:enterobacteria phage integrase